MQVRYKNRRFESALVGVNVAAAAVVAVSFVALFGFDEPLLAPGVLYAAQVVCLCVFIAEKAARFVNADVKGEFWRANWFEVPLLVGLVVAVFGAGRWFAEGAAVASEVRHFAVGIYLILQVVAKLCRTSINLAATGRSPTQTLILSFLVLIVSGASLLMLPKAAAHENLSFVDALFTATSATCVTGLIVKDTGQDFTLMGKLVILALIQLGGLGIVVFGAVFALLLGQALSVRESVAMQDLLSATTLGRIGRMIAFIFVGTVVLEAVGAVSLFNMLDNVPGQTIDVHEQWFCSIFHAISAFCNAGFSLFSTSFSRYDRCWGLYVVVCPLIILGGLGFGVLYDLANIIADRFKLLVKRLVHKPQLFSASAPKRMRLQTKIVLSVSAFLIVTGALAILLFEHSAGRGNPHSKMGILGALFQSITARTAGFNTMDIGALSSPTKFILMLLMFVGGSPGSTAGGIKTVTLAVIVMAVFSVLRKREDVEMFRRAIRIAVVGRAITVTVLFVGVLFSAGLLLTVTERGNGFTMMQIMFEASSALGTVGLSTGITPSLTETGKLIIIAVMLIGRLGPLTLLAALTFNLKPARYNYPEEAIIVG